MDAKAEIVKERILEVVIITLGVFVVSDAAQALYFLTPPESRADPYMSAVRTTTLLQILFKAGLYCLIVQAAGKRLTDTERQRTGGIISWYEPWRVAQAISVFGFILIWGVWIYGQVVQSSSMKVASGGPHPGLLVISGLIVLSSLGWPAILRMMEPKSPFEPES